MSTLLEFLGAIVNVVLGIDSQRRLKLEAEAIDVDSFIEDFETTFQNQGVHRCGEDAICLRGATLVYEGTLVVPPKVDVSIDPEAELRSAGIWIDHIDRSRPRVISFSGRSRGGAVWGRIVPTRGWVFLITSQDERDGNALSDLLDLRLRVADSDVTDPSPNPE